MNYSRKLIEIIFARVPPEMVISQAFADKPANSGKSFYHEKVAEREFMEAAKSSLPDCSLDELKNIFNSHTDELVSPGSSPGTNQQPLVFNLIYNFAKKAFCEKKMEPVIRYEQLLQWFTIYPQVGQDLFTTIYFAREDVEASFDRRFFAWGPIIGHNNLRIKNILDRGMAENHFHLKGSAPHLDLSWICLMNDVRNRREQFNSLEKKSNLQLESSLGASKSSICKLVFKAAVIRAYLYYRIFTKNLNKSYPGIIANDEWLEEKQLKEWLTDDEILSCNISELQQKLELLKYLAGKRYDDNGEILDYALPRNISEKNRTQNEILSGERYFLYRAFKEIYSANGMFTHTDKELLYAYLLIKSRFRAELIQLNSRIGFDNFARYQDRKSIFFSNKDVFDRAVYYMAISSTMRNQNIVSLETRIAPANTHNELRDKIRNIDRIIHFGHFNQQQSVEKRLLANCGYSWYECAAQYASNRNINGHCKECYFVCQEFFRTKTIQPCDFFYTIHFIKEKEKENFEVVNLNPRNHKKREEVRKASIAIAKLREYNKDQAVRVLGIDAANSEIGCRPEVFAQAYRFLKKHKPTRNLTKDLNYVIPPLGITYHVGEDFLDIADGLRAVDEAIAFLNLEQGNRIGHGLVLGLDVHDWYAHKSKQIVLSCQDYLDNIVWLHEKIKELNLTAKFDNLCFLLQDEFDKYFREIYLEHIDHIRQDRVMHYDLRNYYQSWKLRGDNPELYFEGSFSGCFTNRGFWDLQAVNTAYLPDDTIRKNKEAAYLYYSYHYNHNVKKAGSRIITVTVPADYIAVLAEIQKKMQRIVKQKGLAIETNPTSNFRIAQLKKFDKHPILNFYNLGLTVDPQTVEECPQLHVSINTDDQGVFDTYLENEYAIMARALEEMKNADGEPVYDFTMICDWIERVRQMGIEMSFKNQNQVDGF